MEAFTTGKNKFAFLIHFRHRIQMDLGFVWKPLSKVPEPLYTYLLDKYEFPSIKWSDIYADNSTEPIGINQIIPLNGEMIIRSGHRNMTKVVNKTIDKLVDKGYTNIGLGALTSPLTNGGLWLKERNDISITNGNAFTAVSMYQAVEKLVNINSGLAKKIAIVGASGSVGTCLTKMILKNKISSEIIAVGRSKNKLVSFLSDVKSEGFSGEIHITTDIEDIKQADLVCLLTTSTETVLTPDLLKENAVILDGTQPRNTLESLVLDRKDITVIDGGIIEAPGIHLKKGSIGLPDHNYYACFSETVLLSLEGYKEHFCLGNPTLEQTEYIIQAARNQKEYGFHLAPFLSYGKPLKNSIYAV